MGNVNLGSIAAQQRKFFLKGETRDIQYRTKQLTILKEIVSSNEKEILRALALDLKKPEFEAYTAEVMPILKEIDFCLKHLKAWTRPKRVKTPMALLPGSSRIHYQPYGVILNIAPWNYPVQLCLAPLIPALAAGNCAVIKPSEYAPNSSALMARMINDAFPSDYCTVVEGAEKETSELLHQKWDYIVFTGSPQIARIVAQKAATNLTPSLLELGGKNPCVIHKDADLKTAARRIVWGKFNNTGQSCVAPDFLIVEKSIVKTLLLEITSCIKSFYGQNPISSPDYSRIINRRHFDRLVSLLKTGNIDHGGRYDTDDLYIEPTVLHKTDWHDEVMKDEIFGPLLPVLEYSDTHELIKKLQQMESPLSFYIFTRDRKLQHKFVENIQFGSGSINATVQQYANPHLPFGGIGNSGIGRYHGLEGLKTFSNIKSMFKKPTIFDPDLIYPPYKNKLKTVKRFV